MNYDRQEKLVFFLSERRKNQSVSSTKKKIRKIPKDFLKNPSNS